MPKINRTVPRNGPVACGTFRSWRLPPHAAPHDAAEPKQPYTHHHQGCRFRSAMRQSRQRVNGYVNSIAAGTCYIPVRGHPRECGVGTVINHAEGDLIVISDGGRYRLVYGVVSLYRAIVPAVGRRASRETTGLLEDAAESSAEHVGIFPAYGGSAVSVAGVNAPGEVPVGEQVATGGRRVHQRCIFEKDERRVLAEGEGDVRVGQTGGETNRIGLKGCVGDGRTIQVENSPYRRGLIHWRRLGRHY